MKLLTYTLDKTKSFEDLPLRDMEIEVYLGDFRVREDHNSQVNVLNQSIKSDCPSRFGLPGCTSLTTTTTFIKQSHHLH
jgi:hypothetical protein